MSIVYKSIFLISSSCFLIIGTMACVQENLKQLLFYTIIGYFGYFNIILYYIIISNPMSNELLNILIFYLLNLLNIIIGFYYCVLSMKRNGNTYSVKSIYDLAQLWLIDKTTSSCFILLLLGLAGIPFFSGFICKWFFIEEMFQIHKLLGLLSFFMCLFSTYPYIRIINHIVLNKNLMFNKKGPRWYFDRILKYHQKILLIGTTFLYLFITIKQSMIWFFIQYL